MIIALTYVGISVVTLVLLTILYIVEDIHGERVFFIGLRAKLDTYLVRLIEKLKQWFSLFVTGFMRLLFHYGAHSVLKRILAFIQRLEGAVEELVRKNRKVARDIRNRTKNHLDAIAEHKEDVALTPEEKEKMRSHE